jgi:hypothetical protein
MAITRAQQAKQMLQNGGRIGLQGGGADMGGERGPETGREPGPTGGGKGVGGDGDNTNRERGIMRSIPQAATREQMGSLSDPREKQDFFTQSYTGPERFGGLMGGYRDTVVPNTTKYGNRSRLGSLIMSGIGTLAGFPGLGFLTNLPQGTRPVTTPVGGGGSDSQAMVDIPTWMRLGFSSEAEYLASLEDEEDEKEDEGLRLAFRADGGRIGAQEGGIMNSDIVGGEFDFESARQMYGLGKLVKKVTRSVKKIAKSPIGKAAIAAASLYYMPKFGIKDQGGLPAFLQSAKIGAQNLFLGTPIAGDVTGTRSGGIFNFIKDNPIVSIFGASALAGLLTAKQEEEAQELSRGEGIDIDAARRSILARAQGNRKA